MQVGKTRQTRSNASKAHVEEQLQLEKNARSSDKAQFEETIKECKAEVVRLKDAAIIQGIFTHDVEEIRAQCKLKAERAIAQAKTEAAAASQAQLTATIAEKDAVLLSVPIRLHSIAHSFARYTHSIAHFFAHSFAHFRRRSCTTLH